MLSYSIYKIVHYLGIFILLAAFGSLFSNYNKKAVMAHGIGLFLMLLGGFGMHARLGGKFEPWLIGKIVIWLALGGSIVLLKKGILKGLVGKAVILALAMAAVVLVVVHKYGI